MRRWIRELKNMWSPAMPQFPLQVGPRRFVGQDFIDLINPQPGQVVMELGMLEGPLCVVMQRNFHCRAIGIEENLSKNARKTCKQYKIETYSPTKEAPTNPAHHGLVDTVYSCSETWMNEIPYADMSLELAWKCLKPGGAFVGEICGKGHMAVFRSALHNAIEESGMDAALFEQFFYYPTAAEWKEVLQTAGFQVEFVELFKKPVTLTQGELGLVFELENYARSKLTPFLPNGFEDYRKISLKVQSQLLPLMLSNSGGPQFLGDGMIIQFKATKPPALTGASIQAGQLPT
eukprot:TRINITY_DN28108_c0_g1_i2.p2 TRINITY_DN28108_c0_g1~~TRINITY_DN28108_c0_g1_i2.p2  ORF type:complete len:298 (-),score=50.20 TRINITY_DN28108_c0_g1_i2:1221-2090(-)